MKETSVFKTGPTATGQYEATLQPVMTHERQSVAQGLKFRIRKERTKDRQKNPKHDVDSMGP